MRIRQIGADDDLRPAIELLQRFFVEEGFETPAATIALHTRTMAEIDSCVILVAEDGEVTVAVATLSLEFGIEFGWWAELGDLYVVPEWRGQGLARKIISAAEAVLRSRGVVGYQVTVTPYAESHHGLGNFYASLGFTHDGRKLMMKTI